MVSKSPKVDIVQEKAISIVEGFFYSNIIGNFRSNLTEENMEELNIPRSDVKNIEKEFKKTFEKCKRNLESGSDDGEIDSKTYNDFRKKLNNISKNAHKLLLNLEKHIDVDSCEKSIAQFKKEVKTLGKELKFGEIESDDGSMGISIGFENGDEEDYEDELEEIKDFNNFSLDIDEEWITLDDEKGGYFYGQYHQSKNKKYIVAYEEGEVDENNQHINPQVYLIKDNNKILWQKKDIPRPNGAFVTNQGIVIVIDWTSSDKPSGKIFFFNEKGKKLFEYEFGCNIGGQALSDDEEELIISTCFPENSVYLFDVTIPKLVNKIKNKTSQKPLVDFNFKEIRNLF